MACGNKINTNESNLWLKVFSIRGCAAHDVRGLNQYCLKLGDEKVQELRTQSQFL